MRTTLTKPQLIDLTHVFTNDMPVYPGDACSRLYECANIKEHGACVHSIDSGLHVGTHMDAPMHFIDGGAYICDFPVGNFQQRGVVVDARGHQVIGADLLHGHDLQAEDMVLVRTDWCRRFREDDYYTAYPVIAEDFAHALVAARVSLIGLDTPSPDYEPFAIHKILLAADVLIIENLTNLAALEGFKDLLIHAYPMKYKAEAAPVRVVAEVL